MTDLIWIAGATAALLSITLHRARLAAPDPQAMDFGTPMRDAFVNLLAWAALVVVVLLAIRQRGLPIPLLTVACIAAALWWLRRRHPLHGWYRYANALALIAPVSAWLLLQRTTGSVPVFDFMTEFARSSPEVPMEALLPEGGGS